MLSQISFLPRRDHYSVSPCRDPYAQRTTVKTTHSSLFPRGDILSMFLPITLDTTNTHHNHAAWIVAASSHSHNTHTTPQVTSIARACFMPHTHKACILQLPTSTSHIVTYIIHITYSYDTICHIRSYSNIPIFSKLPKVIPKPGQYPDLGRDLQCVTFSHVRGWYHLSMCAVLWCKRPVPSSSVCCLFSDKRGGYCPPVCAVLPCKRTVPSLLVC